MKMGKRVFSAVLSVCLLLGSIPVYAAEATSETDDNSAYIVDSFIDSEPNPAPQSAASSSSATSGQCGDNVYWSFDEATGTLTISGTGDMWDFNPYMDEPAPWMIQGQWSWGNSSIRTVIFKEGVISIGAYAFVGCGNISKVQFPNTLESIGEMSFFNNSGLAEISFPDGLVEIEDQAFFASFNIKEFILPHGLKSVGTQALAGGASVEKTVIPETVTEIGYAAFTGETAGPIGSGCDIEFGWTETIPDYAFGGNLGEARPELVSVIIPEGIESIGDAAFQGCPYLENVELPDSLLEIGNYAFNSCDSLKSINLSNSLQVIGNGAFFFSGLTQIIIPASVQIIGKDTFAYCPQLDTVYYTGTETLWNSLFDSADIGLSQTIIVFNYGNSPTNTVSANVPKSKYLIHVVDSNGNPIPNATVKFSSSEKKTDANGDALFDYPIMGTPTINVTLNGYKPWSNANSNWEKNDNRCETVVLYSDAEGDYIITEALYSDFSTMIAPCNLLVSSKTVNRYIVPDGVSGVDSGNFYIRCSAANDSNVSHYQLWQGDKLISTALSSDSTFYLNVEDFKEGGNCFIRTIANDGTEVDTHINLTINLAEINKDTELTLSGDKITLTVNDNVPYFGGQTISVDLPKHLPVDIEITEDKLHFGLNIDLTRDNTDKVKKRLDSIKSLVGNNVSNQTVDMMEDMSAEEQEMELPGLGKVKVYIIGYLEADWGSSEAKGEIYLAVKASAEFSFNTVVVVIPVTAQIKGSIEAKVGGELTYNWQDNEVDKGADLSMEFGVSAYGGVGADKLASVGVYGEAKVVNDIRLAGVNAGPQKVDLTGELGIKAYLFWHSWEKPYAYNTWRLYTANNIRSVPATLSESLGLYQAENYEVESLDYIKDESVWYGYPISLFSLEATTDFQTLLSGTYRNAQPVIASDGNNLYAAFLRADADGSRIYAAVSAFNGTYWSEPVSAIEGSILDDAPQLLFDSNKVWLTFASSLPNTDTTNLVECATNQTIVIGSVDSNGNFVESSRYTPSENSYAHMQTLAVVNGVPTLFWVESVINDADDIFSSTSNTLKYAVYSNGSWGSAQTLSTINHPIRQLAAGGSGVACNIDTDDNLNTTDDLQLTAYSISGSSSVIANGVTGNVTYGVLPGTSAEGFIWNGDGALYCGSSSISAPGITNEYSIVGDSIYYSSNEEGGTVLTLLKYDGANWSEPISLISSADESRYLENLSAAELNGKDYIFGMNTAVDISADSVTPDKNLVWASVNPVSDLKIDGVEYDTDVLTPGEDVPVTLTVVNGGDHAVSGLQVTVDGVTQDIGTMDLGVGESADIAINIPCPSTETTYNINVTAASEPLADDFNPDDNSYQLVLGLANLVANLTYEQIGTSRTLVAAVTNEGINLTSGTVTFYDANGAAHGETTFSDLESGGVVVVRLPLADSFAGKYDGGDVSVTVTSEQSELYEFDNRATAHIYESTGTSITSVEASGSYVEAQVTYYGEQTDVTAYCAFYDAQGRVLSTEQQNIGVGTQSIRFSNVTDATTAKVFVLDAAHSPLCQAKEVTL